MSQPNPAEQRFTAYLDDHGYRWQHEPDYQIELGLAERPETKPDFLVECHGGRAVAEVRQLRVARTGVPRPLRLRRTLVESAAG